MQLSAQIDKPLNNPDYISGLNPEQQRAVETTQGPVLVLSGAGTGKTRVLTTRIAHILASRLAFPNEILAVTFTNKAAREMAERVSHLLGSGPNKNLHYMGTFHSVSAKILRKHAEKIGFTPTFTILDTDDQIRLLKALSEELHIDVKYHPPKMMLGIIQSWKDRGLVPEKVTGEQANKAQGKAILLYRAYQQRLKSLNALDFGDLILHNLSLFSGFPEALEEYAGRFRYILVDEYQDTNVAQYLWLRLLSLGHHNLCCVGDDDQSIYGWRGAEVGNILRFEQDFPGAAVIRLEQNYRSTKHILGAASGLIAKNHERLGKTLWTDGEDGEKVRIKSVWDGDEEAIFVGEEIEALQRAGSRLSDMAILVRAGFQTRAFEERFLKLGISYKVIGGLRFYERAEIRDAIAYLRVIHEPNDDLAFERIINTPKRGIGNATLEQMHTTARAQNISLTRAARMILDAGGFKGKLATSIHALLNQFERWRGLLASHPISEITDIVIDESGYRSMWQADKSIEAQGRLENLKELVRAMGEFESLTAFLEHVGLITDMDEAAQGDMVGIMTLHAAKGLEFHHVFLPGLEEGLFPHQRALDEGGRDSLEEERRLAYVGITRARQTLTISYAANRRIYNQWQSSIPSRFIAELPEAHVERMEGGAYGMSRAPDRTLLQQQMKAIMAGQNVARPGLAWEASQKPATSTAPATTKNGYSKGDRVFHIKFGYGTVLAAQGTHLEIGFDKTDVKKVLADFVKRA
jgi:DNA helicase-2/ATP-dependent DNA helicase PcrA